MSIHVEKQWTDSAKFIILTLFSIPTIFSRNGVRLYLTSMTIPRPGSNLDIECTPKLTQSPSNIATVNV